MAVARITDARELPAIMTPAVLQQVMGLSKGKTYELIHQAGFPALVSLLSGVGECPSWLPGCDRPSSLRSTETGAELGSSPPYPCRARTVVRCQGARIIQGRASQELRDVVAPGGCWY